MGAGLGVGTVHQVSFGDRGIERPIRYRGSIADKPHGFFDRNPTLDVPDLNAAHACCAGGECHCGR